MYNAIELFCGAGGLALGLESADIHPLLLIDNDKDAINTLHLNRPALNAQCRDIRDVSFSDYSSIDILSGGSPCQAFSYAGKSLGFDDVRGTLFFDYARAVKELQPKIFLFENVRGLMTHDKGRTLATILSIFDALGYQTHYQLMKAQFYKVPQKRERFILVGTRRDLSLSYRFPAPSDQVLTLADALTNCPVSSGAKYSPAREAVYSQIPEGGNWRDLPLPIQKSFMGTSFGKKTGGMAGMCRRLAWDEPALTILTSPQGKMSERIHPDHTRPLTIRESARIQTFPDDFLFTGSIASQYRQIGNAVPPALAGALGASLVDCLSNSVSENKDSLDCQLAMNFGAA